MRTMRTGSVVDAGVAPDAARLLDMEQYVAAWEAYFERVQLVPLTFDGNCDGHIARLRVLAEESASLADIDFALVGDTGTTALLAKRMEDLTRTVRARVDARLAQQGARRADLLHTVAEIERACGELPSYREVSESLTRLEGDPALR
jgi:hypothetical protein